MRLNSWEEDMLMSPRGLSPEILCPSPQRIEMGIDRVFEYSAQELDGFRRLDFLDSAHKNDNGPSMVPETNLHKEGDKLASNRKSEEDSSYRQSEDFSQGNQRENKKIPLYSKNKNISRGNKKIQKISKISRKKRTHRKAITGNLVNDEEDAIKNLKAISRDVLAFIKSMKTQEALSNDELARRIMERVSVDIKQDKNIRRRLYDAVNVLEAVGKVVKTGRVEGNHKKGSYTLIKPLQNMMEEEIEPMKEGFDPNYDEIRQMQKRIEDKTQKLRELKAHKQQLIKLLKRNKRNILRNKLLNQPLHQNLQANLQSFSSRMQIQGEEVQEENAIQKRKEGQTFHAQKKIHFPLYMFEIEKDTKFSKGHCFFAYQGSLKNAYSQFDVLSHLSLESEQDQLLHKSAKRINEENWRNKSIENTVQLQPQKKQSSQKMRNKND